MKYRVNEIFMSLQGEGFWTGTPMVFLRFSGCNLACPFCDTNHSSGTDMSAAEIVSAVLAAAGDCRRVCVTGGEPALQLDDELVAALHAPGFKLHLETNGTLPLPSGIDWVTLSPKEDFVANARVVLPKADELKLVYDGAAITERWASFPATWHFLQPCDTSDAARNAAILSSTVEYIKTNPAWRLSLQTHKLLGIR